MTRFDTSFNFGANAKPKKVNKPKGKKGKAARSDAWRAYVGETRRRR